MKTLDDPVFVLLLILAMMFLVGCAVELYSSYEKVNKIEVVSPNLF